MRFDSASTASRSSGCSIRTHRPGLGQSLLGGVPGERLVLRTDVDRGRDLVDLVDVDDRRDPLDQVAVARLGFALTRLGLAPGGDVFDHALPHRPRSVALDQHGGVAHPHDRSVRTQEPVLDLEALSRPLRPVGSPPARGRGRRDGSASPTCPDAPSIRSRARRSAARSSAPRTAAGGCRRDPARSRGTSRRAAPRPAGGSAPVPASAR